MSSHLNLAHEPAMLEQLIINLRRLMAINNISEAELARKTNIPQPTLHKILSGKTTDPRASTLRLLGNFFCISIDELLTGISNSQQTTAINNMQYIPVISWNECIDSTCFTKKTNPTNWDDCITSEFVSKNAYALKSKPCMEPRFPKGTIFIIDPDFSPVDGDFIVVYYPNTQEATLRVLSIDGPTKLLSPISPNYPTTNLEDDIKIFGILVKSISSYRS